MNEGQYRPNKKCTACEMDTMKFSRATNKNFIPWEQAKKMKVFQTPEPDYVDVYQCTRCGLIQEYKHGNEY